MAVETTASVETVVSVPAAESLGNSLSKDVGVWEELERTIETKGHSFKHVLELWPAYIRRLHLGRFIAHFKLFEQVAGLPGSIVDLGVYRGASFFTWANLLEIFCPGDRHRFVYGFDNFSGLQDFAAQDGPLDPERGKHVGAFSAAGVKDEIYKLAEIHNQDCMIPQRGRCVLIDGDVQETLPKFVAENPGLRISLLHFDFDLYKPTKVALELLYPLVVRGGVVAFDEYGLQQWPGESQAVDEYFAEIGERPVIRRMPYSTQPAGYFIK